MKCFVTLPTILLTFFLSSAIAQQRMQPDVWHAPDFDSINDSRIKQPYTPFEIALNNKTLTNKELLGKTFLLVFWFPTCNHCWDYAQLNALYARMKEDSSLKFVGVTYEKNMVADFLKKEQIDFPIAYTSRNYFDEMRYGNGVPCYVIIDKQGRIAYMRSHPINNKTGSRNSVDYIYHFIKNMP